VDPGQDSGDGGFSPDPREHETGQGGPAGEAWEPEDETGEAAWDDGSQEIWDDAGMSDEAGRVPGDDTSHTALPTKVEAWRKRSATGAILTGFALGLQQVFEPKQDEPAVIMETSGEPPRDLPVEADLEYGRPRHSVVNIRPWLLGDQQQPGDQQAGEARRDQIEEAGPDVDEGGTQS